MQGVKAFPMTFWTIAIVVALKGALVVVLRRKGWWPDWEERARRREEEQRVLVAYRQWRKNAGSGPSPDLRVTHDSFTELDR